MSTPIKMAPTKGFFVRMLTRDIDLRDAILDLLDNCVDGIVRMLKKQGKGALDNGHAKPYKGYFAEITATPKKFVITDNCGGIPENVAITSAFRLGRPSDMTAEKLETVGVYGIGMKRAIFKLGKHAVVTSQHEGKAFKVEITEEWLKTDDLWDLTLEEVKPSGNDGTRIEVTDLYTEIQRSFTPSESNFLEDLNGSIRQLFAVIMGKGFAVKLNKDDLEPIEFKLFTSDEKGGASINPYVFKGRIGKVNAEVVVGFYRRPLTEAEIEDENESPRADLSQAGWSVICNDRLVLRSDKTAVTGWGTANVPRFHNQFSSIAGVVTLRSTDPELLPLNTTKRGIETSSDVYFRLLDYMRAGTKKFTDYTNKWKTRTDEAREQFQGASPLPAGEIPTKIPHASFKKVSDRKLATEDSEAYEYQPTLPQPRNGDANTRIIRFTRPVTDIKAIAVGLLDDEEAKPGAVGEACFDDVLERIKKPRRKS
jgi:Histidine kinase-, DNA gyrase B-, and HSP90-like ATPase